MVRQIIPNWTRARGISSGLFVRRLSAMRRDTVAALELGIFPGAMAEMQNFNCSSALVQAVVDVERRMEKSPELRMSHYRSADVRKGLKQFDVVEKIIGKLLGCFRMFLPRPFENFFQIG
jgi:hypothetical protein